MMSTFIDFFEQIVNAQIVNALVVCALLGLYFLCCRVYSVIRIDRMLFFRFGALGWLVNLVYLMIENVGNNFPKLSEESYVIAICYALFVALKPILVLSLNTISNSFFLFAAKQRFQSKHRKLFHWRTIALASLTVLAIPIVVTFVDGFSSRWDWVGESCSILFGSVAIFAVGRAYQTYFWVARERYPLLTKYSLVYSMYLYALMQPAYFLTPFVNDDYFFWSGMVLKFLHILGLMGFSESFLADYRWRRETFEKAKGCIRQTAQLAHEFNTPALEMRLKLGRLLKHYKNASVVHETGNYLRNLVEQMVSLIAGYQRLQIPQDSQTEDTTVGTYNINTICDSAIISLKSVMGVKTRFEKEYCSSPLVDGRESKLRQAFQNVFKNAIEATEDSKKRNVRVTTSITKGEDYKPRQVLVKVQDTGHGIDEQILPIIFEDGPSTKGQSVERGHGLFIAKTLIEEHQGTIEVMPGGDMNFPGACFVILLPYSQSEK